MLELLVSHSSFYNSLLQNDRKSYEFRLYYQELGETVATIAGFSSLIIDRSLSLGDGMARMVAALVAEYIADVIVWTVLEREGYYLCNVKYRISSFRVSSLIFAVICSVLMVSIGDDLIAMQAPNVTEVGIDLISNRSNMSNMSNMSNITLNGSWAY